MKHQQYDTVGRFKVGQRVLWNRPDPACRSVRPSKWKHIEDCGTITMMRNCESGVLITITTDDARHLVAHIHVGIYQFKPVAHVAAFDTIQVLQNAPRQMEMPA